MAIKLQSLYEAINNQFDVILHTNSFFNKEVTWIHTVEQGEFSHLLHGDELIFNSGLNFTSQDWLKEFLKSLKDAHASGLIISVKSRPAFSQEKTPSQRTPASQPFRCSPLPGTLRSSISCESFLRFC